MNITEIAPKKTEAWPRPFDQLISPNDTVKRRGNKYGARPVFRKVRNSSGCVAVLVDSDVVINVECEI